MRESCNAVAVSVSQTSLLITSLLPQTNWSQYNTMATSVRKVAIPVDGSEHSERACDWYLANVRKQEDKVILIHVSEEAHAGTIETLTPENWEQHVKDHAEKDKELEEKYKQKMTDAGIEYELDMCGGKPGEAICNAVKESEADFVVMGSRGLGTVRRTILGSVSDYVLHHAHLPVIVCPKQ